MKYKVTTRGWIVFSILGILLLFFLFQIGGMLLSSDESESNMNNSDLALEDDSSNENVNTVDHSDESSEITETIIDEDIPDDEINNEDDSSTSEIDQVEENDESDTVDVVQIDLNKVSDILFDKNISILNETYFIILDEWVVLLKENESISITIEGHINGYPYYDDGQYGLAIAQERAEIVKYYLTENGIDETRIHIENKGSSDQVNKDDQAKHYLNRRAVIKIN